MPNDETTSLTDLIASTGMTQAEFARSTGLSPGGLSRLIRGRVRKANVTTLSAMASTLQVPAQQIQNAVLTTWLAAQRDATRVAQAAAGRPEPAPRSDSPSSDEPDPEA